MTIHNFTKQVLEKKLIRKDISLKLDKYRKAISDRFTMHDGRPLVLPDCILMLIIEYAAMDLGYTYDWELEILEIVESEKQLSLL